MLAVLGSIKKKHMGPECKCLPGCHSEISFFCVKHELKTVSLGRKGQPCSGRIDELRAVPRVKTSQIREPM